MKIFITIYFILICLSNIDNSIVQSLSIEDNIKLFCMEKCVDVDTDGSRFHCECETTRYFIGEILFESPTCKMCPPILQEYCYYQCFNNIKKIVS